MDRRYEAAPEGETRQFSQEHGDAEQDRAHTAATTTDAARAELPALPEILPSPTLDFDISGFIAPDPNMAKVNKRASNVQKLAQENEALKAELKAMSDRLEAAERRTRLKKEREQHVMEPSAT